MNRRADTIWTTVPLQIDHYCVVDLVCFRHDFVAVLLQPGYGLSCFEMINKGLSPKQVLSWTVISTLQPCGADT